LAFRFPTLDFGLWTLDLIDLTALGLTLRLALCTTGLLAIVGIPFCYWLARSHFRGKFLIESAVALPLVLPPTVLGFFVLVAAGPHSPLGRAYAALTGGPLPFTFAGILAGSILVNFPFAARPFLAAFAGVDQRLLEASWCLGESRWETFWRIVLPLSWPGILAGLVLTFAHVVGEFGVVLMVGGNIPGVTRTLSMVIYDDVQALNYEAAGRTSLLLLGFAFAVLCVAQLLQRRSAAP
jgi:molybdate transport system permease protein